MTGPEAAFQSQVVKLAKLNGFLVYHTHDSRRSAPGFPDLVMVRDGRLIFAELKANGGWVSYDQQTWLDALHDTQAETYVWMPKNWDAVERTLARR